MYTEGVDPVDKIYLVKQGEFELTKLLIKPVERQPNLEGSALDKKEELKRKYGTASSSEEESGPLMFSLKKFNHREQFTKFSIHNRKTASEEIKICILGCYDIFGYQELLEQGITIRSCTVKCL